MKKLFIAFLFLSLSLITPLASTPLATRAAAAPSFVEAESTITSSAQRRRSRRSGRYRGPVRAAKAPIGASARCRDGTYSFSRNRRGTCSWHGGVAAWLSY
ncbi:MAG TPA: DUF3761 domain-containing protein [Pyrinomonadaceae bacterium]|nr:DUF3761 domain-containing protein [Pyrinomonadaceae bacterium]